jgi:O-antigen/teichoic acid export membrane protein
MGTIRAVAYPAFSKANRENAMLEQQYVTSMTAVTAIAWPFYGFTGLFPLEILRLMFGPQWDLSAPLVPFFCLAGAFSAMVSLIPTLMLAAGHARLMAAADLLIQPVKAVVLSLVVYYYRDLLPFAIAFLIVAIMAVPYFYAFKQRCLPTDFGAVARNLAKNFLLTCLTLVPALAVITFLRQPGHSLPYPLFFACAAMTCIAWLLSLWVLNHPLHRELMAMFWSRFPSKSNF